MWADLAPRRERWVLVSILFDGVAHPDTPEVRAFYRVLYESVGRGLEE
jgi:hypothetical protein